MKLTVPTLIALAVILAAPAAFAGGQGAVVLSGTQRGHLVILPSEAAGGMFDPTSGSRSGDREATVVTAPSE